MNFEVENELPMLPRELPFTEEHEIFRRSFRTFLQREVEPHLERWEEAGIVDREIWQKAGAQGFLAPFVDEQYGGAGVDFLYSVIIIEEMADRGGSGFAISLHNDIIVPYIVSFGNDEQKKRWLPGSVDGSLISAVAMTEPGTGSDLANIKTTAIKDGDHYVVNGSKTFISNGQLCDYVIIAARTNPDAEPAYAGVSLLVVENGSPGFRKGRNLKKLGMHSQDTSELFFEDCRVPVTNLLGQEGTGFYLLMQKLQQERLVIAISNTRAAERALSHTVEYMQQRKAFGKPISKFQHLSFRIVEMHTEIQIARTFLDRLIRDHHSGKSIVKETSMAKYHCSELLKKVVDECLQMFGGYGYMEEYPISRAYRDARVQTIFGGTTEIMKHIIAKQIGL